MSGFFPSSAITEEKMFRHLDLSPSSRKGMGALIEVVSF
jgi:hypothetical protein